MLADSRGASSTEYLSLAAFGALAVAVAFGAFGERVGTGLLPGSGAATARAATDGTDHGGVHNLVSGTTGALGGRRRDGGDRAATGSFSDETSTSAPSFPTAGTPDAGGGLGGDVAAGGAVDREAEVGPVASRRVPERDAFADARSATAAHAAAGAGPLATSTLPQSRDEAAEVLSRYGSIGGSSTGDVDAIGDAHLEGLIEDETMPPELRAAATIELGHRDQQSECSGWFSACRLEEAVRGAWDFGSGVVVGAGRALWETGKFAFKVGEYGLRLPFEATVGSAFGYTPTIDRIEGAAEAFRDDPSGSLRAGWDMAKAVGNHFVDLGRSCTTDFAARRCGEAVGEIGFDVALTVSTGGAGSAAKGAARVGAAASRHGAARSAAALRRTERGLRRVDALGSAARNAPKRGWRATRRTLTGRSLVWADELSPVVRTELTAAFARSGTHIGSSRELTRLLNSADGLTEGAVGRLRREALTDPSLADDVAQSLRAYRRGDDAVGDLNEIARVQYYAMAVPERIRPRLTEAIRTDLSDVSGPLARHLADQPTRVRRTIVGGGPMGQTMANRLHDLGHGHSALVVDAAFGDGNFGRVRRFDLNSTSARYEGVRKPPDASPLHGSPIQVGDLDARRFPSAGAFGDASLVGLHNAWRRGTDVLAETRVTNIVARGPDDVWPGPYRLDLEHRSGLELSVYTDEVHIATGLGKERLLDESRDLLQSNRNRIKRDPARVADVDAVTATDLLEANSRLGNGRGFYEGTERVVFVGGGDSARTAVEDFARAFSTGEGRPQALWYGVDKNELWERYGLARRALDEGVVTSASGRLQRIERTGDGPLRLVFRSEDGAESVIHADKVVTAIGTTPEHPSLLRNLVPDFDASENLRPVSGATRVVDGKRAHDVYVVGAPSGLHKGGSFGPGRGDRSFLEYYGEQTLRFTENRLARGPPGQSRRLASGDSPTR